MVTKNVIHIIFILLLFTGGAGAQTLPWLWTEHSTGTLADGHSVAVDNSGNVFAGGDSWQTGPISFGSITLPLATFIAFSRQAFWVKYSSTGTPLWADKTQNGYANLISVTSDPDGNLIVFGSFLSPSITIGGITLTNAYGTTSLSANNENAKYYIAKYDPSGTLLWAVADGNCHAGSFPISPGVLPSGARAVTTDASGNIYITSSFQRASMTIGTTTLTNTDATGTTEDIFVAKYSPSGTAIWAKSIGGTLDDWAMGITVPASGDVYITGTFFSPSIAVAGSTLTNPYGGFPLQMNYAFIARFNNTGTSLWGMSAGGKWGAYGISLAHDAVDNIYMTGSFGDTTIFMGSSILTRVYPPNYFSIGGYEAQFLVKIAPANTVSWWKTISSPIHDVFGFAVAVSCNNVWVCTSFADTANVDGHIIPLTPASITGVYNLVFAGYNSTSGSLVNYAGEIRYSGGSPSPTDLAGDNMGNVYTCGMYDDSLILGNDTIRTPGGYYMFTAKFGAAGPDSTYIHQDTVLCSSSITLTPPADYSSYLWNNASTLPVLTISDTGTYWVICTNTVCGSAMLADTFHVSIGIEDTVYKEMDTSFCQTGAAVTISAPADYSSYLWNTGSTDSFIAVSTSKLLFVVAHSGCNTAIDTFNVIVNAIPTVSIQSDSGSCNSIMLTAATQPEGSSYLWSTGSTDNSLGITQPGIYWLSVTNASGCSAADTVNIAAISSGHTLLSNVTADQTIAYGSSVQLNADSEVIYMWKPDDGSLQNPNINNPVATPLRTTIYTVYGYDQQGCIDSASVVISVDDAMSECIPKAFTPNGDGLNDVFRPACIKFQQLVDFRVYNRWGQQVFYSNDYRHGWDGTFNGVPQDFGVYYYDIIVARPGSSNIFYKGDVTLLR